MSGFHRFDNKPPTKYGNDEAYTAEQDARDHDRENLVPGDAVRKKGGGLVTDEMYAEFLEKHHGIKRNLLP